MDTYSSPSSSAPQSRSSPQRAAAGDKSNEAERRYDDCIGCAICFLLIFLLLAGVVTHSLLGVLKPYTPTADVVSAFVKINHINNISNGPSAVGRLLTANWAVTLHIRHVDCCRTYHPYRYEASVFHAADNDSSPAGGGKQRLLASTRRFSGSTVDESEKDVASYSIQLRAEEATVGERVVADLMEAAAENRLRFKLLVRVRVRVESDWRTRYYLARISCDPFWIGSSSISGTESTNMKKCQVPVTLQTKPTSQGTRIKAVSSCCFPFMLSFFIAFVMRPMR